MKYGEDWIIVTSSPETHKVSLSRFFGTEHEVKLLLIELMGKDKEESLKTFEFVPTIDDIEESGVELSICARYPAYQVIYTAKRFKDLEY